MNPVQIKVNNKKELMIKWDDNSESMIEILLLRKHCPCATCIAERDQQGKLFIPLFAANQVLISEIKTIGNYALGITWKDGHYTGIYEYPFLRYLSQN